MRLSLWALALALAPACGGSSFDGLYRVQTYTMNQTSCAGPGDAINRGYAKFEIRNRDYFGVKIYPVYPCDDAGVCQEDNDSTWSLVVVERDLDKVSIEYAESEGNSCVLRSEDKVISAGAEGEVVLQSRRLQVVLEPYDATTCTTDNAKAKRDSMSCAGLMQLVGVRESEAR